MDVHDKFKLDGARLHEVSVFFGRLLDRLQCIAGRATGCPRNLRTGEVRQTLSLPADFCVCRVAFGFGSVWLLEPGFVLSAGTPLATISRIDELSGRRLTKIVVHGDASSGTIATGNGAVWVLESNGKLLRIDPVTNRVARSYETKAIETRTLVPVAGYEWICECIFNTVLRFDGRTGRSKTFKIPDLIVAATAT